ncbi:hypothetical protein PGT21_017201 [Puccinia graminis f. sp. tritici]|uniref:Uncharacterized protein n=1 Tax=Puccinia graminis f. sp. tritici TaxID=56615 RepID=A0A5B0QY14_PUCGR|nr:hypothetical protein PGT21_017201 [Puccinia graminis f. sp. tritici]
MSLSVSINLISGPLKKLHSSVCGQNDISQNDLNSPVRLINLTNGPSVPTTNPKPDTSGPFLRKLKNDAGGCDAILVIVPVICKGADLPS